MDDEPPTHPLKRFSCYPSSLSMPSIRSSIRLRLSLTKTFSISFYLFLLPFFSLLDGSNSFREDGLISDFMPRLKAHPSSLPLYHLLPNSTSSLLILQLTRRRFHPFLNVPTQIRIPRIREFLYREKRFICYLNKLANT